MRRIPGEEVGDATRDENAQASAWSLVMGDPSWTVVEYQVHYG